MTKDAKDERAILKEIVGHRAEGMSLLIDEYVDEWPDNTLSDNPEEHGRPIGTLPTRTLKG